MAATRTVCDVRTSQEWFLHIKKQFFLCKKQIEIATGKNAVSIVGSTQNMILVLE